MTGSRSSAGWGQAIAELFTSSDLALSAGGQTLNELAYLGVPFLAIQTGTDQYWNINSYLHSGVTPYHFSGDDLLLESKLLKQIDRDLNRLPCARKWLFAAAG